MASPLLITKGQDICPKVRILDSNQCHFSLHAEAFNINYYILYSLILLYGQISYNLIVLRMVLKGCILLVHWSFYVTF